MSARRLFPVLVLVAVAACSGGEPGGSDSTSTASSPGTPSPSPSVPSTAPTSGVPLARVLEPYEAELLAGSDFDAYRLECVRLTGQPMPDGSGWESEAVERDDIVGRGTVLMCTGRTDPGADVGGPDLIVLDDEGSTTSWWVGSDGIGHTPPAAHGLLCREYTATDRFVGEIELLGGSPPWNDDVGAFQWALAYWFLQGEPEQMDVDRNGIPCELIFDPDVIAEVWSTGVAPTTAPDAAGDEAALLDGDGIGPFDFGAAAAAVEAWAIQQFGLPEWRVELRPPVPSWADQLSRVELDGAELLYVRWTNGLELAFSDRSEFGDDGSLHLAWWSYSPSAEGALLETVDGFTVPSTTAEFTATYPTANPWSLSCEWLHYAGLEVPRSAPIGAGLRGLHLVSPSSGQDTLTSLSAGAPWRCPSSATDQPQSTRPGELMTGLQLDGSGLSGIPFGTPIDEVRTRLEPLLGRPNVVFTDTTSLPEYNLRRGCYLAAHESTEMTWTSPQLSLWFHDGPTGESDGVVRFVYWSHGLRDGTPVIATPAGARPGIEIGDLIPLEPTLRLGPPGDCGCHRVLFDENGPMELTSDWNSTVDVQRFLVDHGYPVEVTGEIDEPTTQAINDHLAEVGLDEGFYCGCADFRTLDALGFSVPASDAIVTRMSAGTAGRCDCGC